MPKRSSTASNVEPIAERVSGSAEQSIEERRALNAKLDEPGPIDPMAEPPLSIEKPPAFNLALFKTKGRPTIAGVETLLSALPHHRIAEAKDWVRLHPDEEKYWSSELCFVTVPIVGERNTLHLIVEEIAKAYLPAGRIQRYRLALASKPDNAFFLCHVPTQNLDNAYNKDSKRGCEKAKTLWTQVSRREDGHDGYQVQFSRDPDAFHEPDWPTQSLDELIGVTFADRLITTDDHPALLRLIGARQSDE